MALDQLCTWADKWGMVFNVGKCKVMHMGHQNPAFNYTMKGQCWRRPWRRRTLELW